MTAKGAITGRCAACRHPERARIEFLMATGAGAHSIARKFSVGHDTIYRHWKLHVPESRKIALKHGPVSQAALAARVDEEASSVLDHLKIVRAGLYQLYDSAVEAGDINGAALVAGQLHKNLNAVARLTGELAESPLIQSQVNIFVSPQFAELQATLIRVLAQFPEARTTVIHEFRKLEARSSAPVIEHEHGRTQSHTPEPADAV